MNNDENTESTGSTPDTPEIVAAASTDTSAAESASQTGNTANVDAGGEPPHTSLSRADNRWGQRRWLRDWAILLALVIAYLVWTGIIYTFEPGIR